MGKIRRFATRTLKAVPLVFENEAGERVTEQFDVTYRSYSQKALDEIAGEEKKAAAAQNKEDETSGSADDVAIISFSAFLSHLVTRIVDATGEDLTNEKGEKQELNREFFDSLSIGDGTKVIWDRIQADINPQKPSSEPGPSGSSPAPSEG
jgi:hypothetical protein